MPFNWTHDPFEEFEREFTEMSRMMDEMLQGLRGLDWAERPLGEPAYYGVSVNVGPDGVPHIERFGNVHPRGAPLGPGPVDPHIREPFATSLLDEERGVIQVTAELPGIEESSIHVEVHGDELILRAEGKDRVYEKTMELPARAEAKTLTKRYRNGVLEITVKQEA